MTETTTTTTPDPIWTVTIEWPSDHGDLEIPVCVVRAKDADEANEKGILLIGERYAGCCDDWPTSEEVVDDIFGGLCFRGDVSGLLAGDWPVYREKGIPDFKAEMFGRFVARREAYEQAEQTGNYESYDDQNRDIAQDFEALFGYDSEEN